MKKGAAVILFCAFVLAIFASATERVARMNQGYVIPQQPHPKNKSAHQGTVDPTTQTTLYKIENQVTRRLQPGEKPDRVVQSDSFVVYTSREVDALLVSRDTEIARLKGNLRHLSDTNDKLAVRLKHLEEEVSKVTAR